MIFNYPSFNTELENYLLANSWYTISRNDLSAHKVEELDQPFDSGERVHLVGQRWTKLNVD